MSIGAKVKEYDPVIAFKRTLHTGSVESRQKFWRKRISFWIASLLAKSVIIRGSCHMPSYIVTCLLPLLSELIDVEVAEGRTLRVLWHGDAQFDTETASGWDSEGGSCNEA